METISAGASVIAFVGLALQATKSTYEFFSAFRDARTDVQQILENLSRFQALLEQLHSCSALHNSEVRQDPNATAIMGVIKQYLEMVTQYKEKIEKLNVPSDGRCTTSLKRRFKTVFNEKDLKQVQTLILDHLAILNVRFSALQISMVLNSAQNLEYIRTQNVRHSKILEQQKSHISELSKKLTSIDDERALLYSLQHQMLHQVEKRSRIDETVTNMLKHITEVLETSYGPSEARGNTVSLGQNARDRESENDISVAPAYELSKSIARLLELVHKEEGIVDTEQVYEIIEDLSILLQAPSKTLKLGHSQPLEHSSDELVPARKMLTESQNLRKIEGLFLSSMSLSINKPIKRQRPESGSGKIDNYTYRNEYRLGSGTLAVTTHKRRCLSREDNQNDSKKHEVFTATVTFLPQAGRSMVAAMVRQTRGNTGFISIMPSLSVHPLLPETSPIFGLAQSGAAEELLEMLRKGEASVRIHDENGTPLLHYATNPRTCQLLLDWGADAEEVGPAIGYAMEYILTPLDAMMSNDSELDQEELERLMACRMLLLRAGADPTIQLNEPYMSSSAFVWLYRDSNVNALRTFLDFSGSYIDLNSRGETGHTILHDVLYFSSASDVLQKYTLLLHRGASVKGLNYGNTCLHDLLAFLQFENVFLRSRHNFSFTLLEARSCCLLLIQKGADIFAVNHLNMSVSCFAYHLRGFVGDLWDSVLARLGYDVSQFRKGHPRIADYRRTNCSLRYSRHEFEKTWAGIHHLCPYYDYLEHQVYYAPDEAEDKCHHKWETLRRIYGQNEDKDGEDDEDDEEDEEDEDDDEDEEDEDDDEDKFVHDHQREEPQTHVMPGRAPYHCSTENMGAILLTEAPHASAELVWADDNERHNTPMSLGETIGGVMSPMDMEPNPWAQDFNEY